jgi:hypothetical protein
MTKCKNCHTEFTYSQEDRDFLRKLDPIFGGYKLEIPDPTFCRDCRQQRRLSFRNERTLYRRKCDKSGKSIISVYAPDSGYIVYSTEEWWSDDWNAFDYGKDFDFSRPFFEQFNELKKSIPHLALHNVSNENCDYVNLSGFNKNCYLIHAGEYNEDCMYGTSVIKCQNSLDMINCFESRWCYEVVDVQGCANLSYSQDCTNCSDSMFLYNCRNSKNCLFSSNLRNAEYYVFNKKCTKEEYEEKLKQTNDHLLEHGPNQLHKQFAQLKKSTPHKAQSITNSENSTGNYISNSKNTHESYDCSYCEDCRYITTAFQIKDAMDLCHLTEIELAYEGMSIGYKSYNVLFSHGAWTSSNIIYCDIVHNCSDCFGCTNLDKARYCILNKQYSKAEYEELVQKIIVHMKQTGEWGEYLPASMSPFKYEDTVANEYFPKSVKETKYEGDIPEGAYVCEVSGRPFMLTKSERKFYKTMQVPSPTFHPDERHKIRFEMRAPRSLVERECANCHVKVQTPFTKERVDTVLCEQCYLDKIY